MRWYETTGSFWTKLKAGLKEHKTSVIASAGLVALGVGLYALYKRRGD